MSSSPTASNSDKTFTVTPSSSLSYSTTYKILVTTGVKDLAGNNLSEDFTISDGFQTHKWETTTEMTTLRMVTISEVVNGIVYVIGGDEIDNVSNKNESQLYQNK